MSPTRRADVVRLAALAGLGITYLVTAPLWGEHHVPTTVPIAGPVVGWSWLWALLPTLALAVVLPRVGLAAHLGVLTVATAGDALRLQPEFPSLALLAVAATAGWWELARYHLAAMWLWAGLGKALSPDFVDRTGAWLLAGLPGAPPARGWAWALAGAEVALGVAALVPWARRWLVGWAGAALHVGALLVLVGYGWNEAVWPWNLVLAVASPLVFDADVKAAERVAWRWVGAVLVAVPAGYQVGVTPVVLAHQLYTDQTPTSTVCVADGSCSFEVFGRSIDRLRVPVPSDPWILRAVFQDSCRRGQVLVLDDRRRFVGPLDASARVACRRGRSPS